MKNRLTNSRFRSSAFTLIEIMVVLAVIAIIATMAVPAMNGVLKGSKMTQASDEFERDIARAHAAAQRDNYPIEFRFYLFSDPEQPNSEEAFRAYQAIKRVRDSSNHTADPVAFEPVTPVKMLPPGIIFSAEAEYSSILKLETSDERARDYGNGVDDSIPRLDDVEYKVFYFRPDGSTSLASERGFQQWFVTIQKENAVDGELPADFVTFQVDAYNGQIRRYEKSL